jgi:PTH1 family peptidyl-tRNA hydrolase
MKVVVGLGNPGREYTRTRHNVGFMVVERIKSQLAFTVERKRFRSNLIEGHLDGEKIVLVEPQTFMNLSGQAVREVLNWYKVAKNDLLIVYDDIDLPFGSLRLRADGSAGGHNGMRSVIDYVGTDKVARLKVGVGRPRSTTIGHVLSRFNEEEESELPTILDRSADAVRAWIKSGAIAAMNEFNRKSG